MTQFGGPTMQREPVLTDEFTRENDPRSHHKWHADALRFLAKQLGVGNDFYFPLMGAAKLIEEAERIARETDGRHREGQ